MQTSVNSNHDDKAFILREYYKYINSMKKIYNAIFSFLENFDSNEYDFQELIKVLNAQQYEQNTEEFEHFLHLIQNISSNYHHKENFMDKIFHILLYYKNQIKQTFSNFEIFNIFKSNKILLLFLFENEIIKVDENVYLSIINTIEKNGNRYCHFFYPEIKNFNKEAEIEEIESIHLDNFDLLRHKGQNDSYICTLIQQDLVENFISHVNRYNISLTSKIVPSIFETNSILIENNTTLIEYAALYGSIQIFQYLFHNGVKLSSSLWLYTIHSKNSDLIHLLEYNKVKPPNNNYEECFNESIKCHHNSIAEYIKDNLMDSKSSEKSISYIFKYHNYFYFPSDFNEDYEFYYMSKFNYNQLIYYFIKKKEKYVLSRLLKSGENLSESISRYKNYKVLILYYLLLINNNYNTANFKSNSIIERISIPPSITFIADKAFIQYNKLKEISIPSSVTSIGNYCFFRCESLKKIKIPPSVISIGSNTFEGCTSLAQISIPFSVVSIGSSTFLGCSSLKEISIPSTVTSIGNYAFFGCKSLSRLSIPSFINIDYLGIESNVTVTKV